ncbi:uncharacterized mitochondrial protein AtMg00810-like [Spinacia oleracea]|uniref:Uncharacterized mitochondrial protein AtMg00810-like n=1 Tax=Spinacia oleracea TaxID=3562 RepID=A0A9R0JC83_SPIOL|nr:uncharacterized mitochondrial protein AtMg00810-like [Spinacia oleracea]
MVAKLDGEFQKQGFVQSKTDYSLFIKKDALHITLAAVYVGGILLTGNHLPTITALKKHLDTTFSIKDLGIMNYFLGIEVGYLPDGIVLTLKKFTKSLLANCGFDISKPTVTPLPINTKLLTDEGFPYDCPEHYRTLVGKLNFLTHTRPDLCYAVQLLSQFMHLPRMPHVAALHHVLRYVAHTEGQGILMRASDSLSLQAFLKVIMIGMHAPIREDPLQSKKQNTIPRSSSEAECRDMAGAASKVTWHTNALLVLHTLERYPSNIIDELSAHNA